MNGDLVIVGGGCAGLSLAVHLLEAGVRDRRITVVEPKVEPGPSRSWCMWRTEKHPFDSAVARRWPSWRVAANGEVVIRGSTRHPYEQVPSDRFRDVAVARLARASNVDVRLGERVIALDEGAQGVRVRTDRQTLKAKMVFDSRPPSRSELRGVRLQHFAGWRVRTRDAVFEPATATLMDFQPHDHEGLHFVYVLPYSPDLALVEATWFSRRSLPLQAYRDAVDRYLRQHLETEAVECELAERGVIPMTDRTLRHATARIIPIGVPAGAARPSTGYAFLAIQRAARELAAAVRDGRALRIPRPYSRYLLWLDRLFLGFLDRYPDQGPRLFLRLFRDTPANSLVRFLSGRGSALDEIRTVLAMPRLAMLRHLASQLTPGWREA